jgi:hypothetical protein
MAALHGRSECGLEKIAGGYVSFRDGNDIRAANGDIAEPLIHLEEDKAAQTVIFGLLADGEKGLDARSDTGVGSAACAAAV